MQNVTNRYFDGNETLSFIIFFLMSFLALHLFYAPSVMMPFAQNDDYNYFRYIDRSTVKSHPQYEFFRWTGRQGQNLIIFFLGKTINKVSDTVFVRIVIELLLAFGLACLMKCLARGLKRPLHAFVIILPIGFMPAFGATILWISMTPYVVAMVLGILASIPLFALSKTIVQQNFCRKTLFQWKSIFLLGSSSAPLLFGIYIYPTWAYFIFVPVIIDALFNESKSFKERVTTCYLTLGLTLTLSVSFFVFHKFIYLPLYFEHNPHLLNAYLSLPIHSFNLAGNIFSRFVEVMVAAVPIAINFWYFELNSNFWIITLSLLSLGLLISLLRIFISHGLCTKQQNSLNLKRLMLFVSILGFLFVSLSPIIFAVGAHFGFRLLILFSILCYLLAAWSLLQIFDYFLSLAKSDMSGFKNNAFIERKKNLAVLCIFAALTVNAATNTSQIVYSSALNNLRELEIVRNEVVKHIRNQKGLNFVHIVAPPADFSYDGKRLLGNGEFFFNSAWAGGPWLVSVVLIDLLDDGIQVVEAENKVGLTPMPGKVIVTKSYPSEPVHAPFGTLIIDFTKYYSEKWERPDVILGGMYLDPTPDDFGNHGVIRAFDNSAGNDSFWEAAWNDRVSLDISFPKLRKFNSISLEAGEKVSGMPTDWQVYGSENSSEWLLLADVSDTEPYKPGEKRQFKLYEPDMDLKHLRFIFNNASGAINFRLYEMSVD